MLISIFLFTALGALIGLSVLQIMLVLISIQKAFIIQLVMATFRERFLNQEKMSYLFEQLQLIELFKEVVNEQINEVMLVFKQRKPMLTFILTPELEGAFKQTAQEIILKNWPSLKEQLAEKVTHHPLLIEVVQEELQKAEENLVKVKAFKALKNSLRMIATLFGAAFGLIAGLLWAYFKH